LTDYLIGTGGWAYFNIPNKPRLKAYSEVFNFVEVNYTFYEYPDRRTVEHWRKMVPENFAFAVRCHQDLTHRVGLKPIDEAYCILSKMVTYCGILNSPFLVLETPASYLMKPEEVNIVRDFFSSSNLRGIRLVWEIRAPVTSAVVDLMRDFNVIQCVDMSGETPSVESDVVYTRLFGKGKHNIYQFTDDELLAVDQKVESINPRIAALSYHGFRMHSDAVRYMQYKKTKKFLPITAFTGVASAKAVLSEDAKFPTSKSELIEKIGWRVIDLTVDRRVHLSELLSKLPDITYRKIDEVTEALEAVV